MNEAFWLLLGAETGGGSQHGQGSQADSLRDFLLVGPEAREPLGKDKPKEKKLGRSTEEKTAGTRRPP